jgi:polyphenol oxidase
MARLLYPQAEMRTPARREFLLCGGLAAGWTLWGATPSAIRADEPDDCSPPPSSTPPVPFKPDSDLAVRTRRNFGNIPPNDPYLTQLKNAYKELRALHMRDPKDPRGWLQQANAHCWYCGGGDNMAAGEEIHGSWWFFPWHRCYLYFHERILGKLLGDKTFTLPYWDWFDAQQRTLPAPYTNPNDPSNPLFDDNRLAKPMDTIPDAYVGSAVQKRVMGQPTADLFMGTDASLPQSSGGRLENGPHGAVHLWVGNPATLVATPDMGVLATAAQDPVFFAHHANIDRLWDAWLNDQTANPPHVNPSDSRWANHRWTFYDEEGKWTSISVQDVLDHEKNLRYRYEEKQPVSERIALTGKPLTRKVALPAEPVSVYVLNLDGIEVPPNMSAVVRVFANLPDASPTTSLDDPHYIGYFTILAKTSKASGRHKKHNRTNVTLDIPPSLARTIKDKSELDITLVPLQGLRDAPTKINLTFERMRITTHK